MIAKLLRSNIQKAFSKELITSLDVAESINNSLTKELLVESTKG